ncbi:MAG: hypothetical protein F4Z50_11560 [Gemmatimonadetes bacterium]|nr:hypothetical protein [Gemmatimonadota bacterium]MYD15196.1 hypothetical protein [Gemmatimonadota bacterium]
MPRNERMGWGEWAVVSFVASVIVTKILVTLYFAESSVWVRSSVGVVTFIVILVTVGGYGMRKGRK